MLYDKRWDAEIPTTVEPVDWREILLKAAELVEQGWVQGSYQSSDRYCAVGAISMAATGDAYGWSGQPNGFNFTDMHAREAANQLLQYVNRDNMWTRWFGRKHHYPYCNIVSWNDSPGRTKKQVVHAMRKAADAV
jgi:hypothetical protein